MRTELLALRTVAAYRRALALAIAFSGFLAISFLGVRDLASTARGRRAHPRSPRARSPGSWPSSTPRRARVGRSPAAGSRWRCSAATTIAAARSATGSPPTRAAGATLGLAGAATAAVLTFGLLGAGGGPLPGAGDLVGRAAGTILYGALMGALGAALGLALRSPAAAVITALVVLLALDPLFAGHQRRDRPLGPGRRRGLAHRQRRATTSRPPGPAASRCSPTPPRSARSPRRSPPAATCPNLVRHARERRRRHRARRRGADPGHGRRPAARRRRLRGHAAVLRPPVRATRTTSRGSRAPAPACGWRSTLDALRAEVAALLEQAGPIEGCCGIVLTRGGRRIALIEPLPRHKPVARVATIRYAPNRVLDGLKTLSYAGNMLATRLAKEGGYDEALLVSPHGRVLEGSTWSFFWVRDGELLTPPLEDRILGSITRARVIGGDRRPRGGRARSRTCRPPTRRSSPPPSAWCSRSPRSTSSSCRWLRGP